MSVSSKISTRIYKSNTTMVIFLPYSIINLNFIQIQWEKNILFTAVVLFHSSLDCLTNVHNGMLCGIV